MILRSCLGLPGQPCGIATPQSRCPRHTAERKRRRGTRHQRGLGNDWVALRNIAVAQHIGQFGWTCPGFGVPSHPSRDLTGDHIVPRSAGGVARSLDDVRVLCRGCNSRRGAKE